MRKYHYEMLKVLAKLLPTQTSVSTKRVAHLYRVMAVRETRLSQASNVSACPIQLSENGWDIFHQADDVSAQINVTFHHCFEPSQKSLTDGLFFGIISSVDICCRGSGGRASPW